MKTEITLYGTSACHLCDDALAVILPVAKELGMVLNSVDIANDLALENRYSLVIPVLSVHHGDEIYWPFDTNKVRELLLHHKN